MNQDDQKRFVRDLLIAFPAFDDAARNSPDIAATHRSWASAWSDLGYVECSEVLAELSRSGNPSYDDYKRPGAFIRGLVLAARNRGKSSEQDRAESSLRRTTRKDYVGSPMAQALSMALKAKAEGKTESECLAIIDQMLPKSNDFDGPTYKCKTCCDRGLVVVWRSDFIQLVRDGKLSVEKLVPRKHTYPIACHCDAGYRINQPANQKMKLPHYSSGHFILFRDRAIELEREFVQEWLEEQRRPVAWVG